MQTYNEDGQVSLLYHYYIITSGEKKQGPQAKRKKQIGESAALTPSPHLDTPGKAFSEPHPIPFYDSPGAYIRVG